MPMKPTSPESLKGLLGSDSERARVLDDDEVEALAAKRKRKEGDEDEDDEEVEE